MTFDRVRHPLAPLERSQESEPPRDFVRARGVTILGVESDTIKTWSGYFDFRSFAEQMRCRCARVRRVVVRSPIRSRTLLLAVCIAAVLGFSGLPAVRAQEVPDNAASFYVGRISSVNAWHDLIKDPANAEFVDAYLAVTALSRVVGRYRDDRLTLEVEGQVGYNFGDQSHWEINLAAGPRWRQFPWNDVVATSVAFGLGLSMASEVPEVEVELEGSSEKLLIYWNADVTLGPPRSSWAVLLRLHHRSGGFGSIADDGGMNAVALGLRITF